MAIDPSRTYHASQAIQVSDLIMLKFANHRFGENIPRILRVSEPDGPSTDGGRKARQSILLVPEKGEGNTVLCGFVHAINRTAELRSYEVLSTQYQARYSVPLEVKAEEYEHFLVELEQFLKTQAIDVAVSTAAAPRATSVRKAMVATPAPRLAAAAGALFDLDNSPRLTLGAAMGMGFILGFLACYVIFVP